MSKFPGPVFAFEVRKLPRRWQAYGVRAAYGLVLLLILAQNYYGWLAANDGAKLSARQASLYALTTFASFAVYQLGAVLALTPALVAGVVADERQRKTLHYLLASRLGGGSIVLGKLGARLLHLVVCLAVGFPVMSLLTLLGGIDPRLLGIVFGATASTAYLVASASVLLSVHARRVRDAVFAAYAIEAVWLLSPFLSDWLLRQLTLPGWAMTGLTTGFEWFEATSPSGVVRDALWSMLFRVVGPRGPRVAAGWMVGLSLAERLYWLIGLQLALGTAMAVLAAWRLRPAFRSIEAASERPRGSRYRFFPRFRLPRPDCGDAPVRWKEVWTGRRGGLVRRLGSAASLLLGAGVVGAAAWFAYDVFTVEPTLVGAGVGRSWILQRLNGYLTAMVPLLGVVLAMTQVAHGASAITGEREADTWTSLTATVLTPTEVVGGKVAGAIWRGRWPMAAIAALLAIGVLTRAVEPWGAAAALAALAVFSAFAATFGVMLSACLPTTHRAQVFGIGLLLLLNVVGQATVGILSAIFQPRSMVPVLFPGCQPAVVGRMINYRGPLWSVLNEDRLPSLLEWNFSGTWLDSTAGQLASALLTALFYAAATYACWRAAVARYDVVAGRPRAGGDRPSWWDRALMGRAGG
ncbi:MAG: ABC transporter permease [Isosphaeraceae bacterium]